MCGIAGLIPLRTQRRERIPPIKIIERMTDSLTHRGPDSCGTWHDENYQVFFGHRRLSILDLSENGYQPMRSPSGRYTICFNGEIYNFKTLNRELSLDKEYHYSINSDTATLLYGIEEWGLEKTLQKTNGMFAFALWDNKKQEICLARDRLGQKPLYYGFSEDNFLFASELKAITSDSEFNRRICASSLFHFFRRGNIPHPASIFEGIYKLRPGSFLVMPIKHIRSKKIPEQRLYWNFMSVASEGVGARDAAMASSMDEIKELLRLSVKEAMVADTPVGAFLSGGIDSTLIASIMSELSTTRLNTYTIGFWDKDYDEAPYAKKIAKHLGTDHHECYVQPSDALAVIPKLPVIFDEPFADSSQIPTFLVSQIASSDLKVVLSGDGGDEIFGGYNRYTWNRYTAAIMRYLPTTARSYFFDLLTRISPKQWDNIFSSLHLISEQKLIGDKIHKLSHMLTAANPSQSYDFLTSVFSSNEPFFNTEVEEDMLLDTLTNLQSLELEDKMMIADTLTYLPDDILTKVDRSSMFNSLEVRAPFLDHRLIEAAWRVPLREKICSGQGKLPLRKILGDFIPHHLIDRPKSGFAIPLGSWMRNELKDWCEDLLAPSIAGNDENLNGDYIHKIWSEHISGRRNWQHKLWAILMYQSWKKEYCE